MQSLFQGVNIFIWLMIALSQSVSCAKQCVSTQAHMQTSSSFVHLSNEDVGRELIVTQLLQLYLEMLLDPDSLFLSVHRTHANTHRHTDAHTRTDTKHTGTLQRMSFSHTPHPGPCCHCDVYLLQTVLCWNWSGHSYVECGSLDLPLVVV